MTTLFIEISITIIEKKHVIVCSVMTITHITKRHPTAMVDRTECSLGLASSD